MSIPSSGQLSIKQIYNEAVYGNHNAGNTPSSTHITAGLTSLKNLETSAKYGYGGITSAWEEFEGDGSAPHQISEFHEGSLEGV